MVSFDHREAGTSAAAWTASGVGRLPWLDSEQINGETRLLVVVAHPDDETLGATALIRATLHAGGQVHLVVCSAGENSHPDSPTHSQQMLRRMRAEELREAAEQLATGHSDRLSLQLQDLPDGSLAEDLSALESVLHPLLSGAAESEGFTVLVTHLREDGHGDHEAVASVVVAAAEQYGLPVYEFPLWYWHWAQPHGEGAHAQWRHFSRWRLAGADRQVRRRALAAHRSQLEPLSPAPGDEVIVSAAMLEHFDRDFDIYRYTHHGEAGSSRACRVFDRVHAEQDPWGYLSSGYEARKRALTTAMLPWPRYQNVVEVGCSTGMLTAHLAERAHHVVGIDASKVALERAGRHLAGQRHVDFVQAVLPAQWPPELQQGDLDLVVVSEVGYYLTAGELKQLIDRVQASLSLEGQIMLCHWRHRVSGWPLDGNQVHEMVRQDDRFMVVNQYQDDDVTLEVLARRAGAERAVVVIPAREEAELLPACLEAVQVAADQFEALHHQGAVVVAVAVDESCQHTVRLAQRFADQDARFHAVLISEETQNRGVGRARDAGIRHGLEVLTGTRWGSAQSTGHRTDSVWIASTDADSIVSPGWLVGHAVIAADADLVLGTVQLPEDETSAAARELAQRWNAEYAAGIEPRPGHSTEQHSHVHGANLGINNATYQLLGGFPHVAFDEDVALVAAARGHGVRILASTQVPVLTSPRLNGRTPHGFAEHLRLLRSAGTAEKTKEAGGHEPFVP